MKANALQNGDYVEVGNEPLQVIEHEFVKPGKGSAFVRLKLKSCINGAVRKETFSSEVHVKEADITVHPFQFLYAGQGQYHCMNTETYEQFTIDINTHQERGRYMQEGEEYSLKMWDDKAIVDINIPTKVAYEVCEAAAAVRGNTVSGATKSVSIQNDVSVKVPLFINKGDKILVNTETGKYVERVT